jgi:Domain of unknown function (DUF3883)
MARASGQLGATPRVLFARVGWMHFYKGPVPGDERPVGGGRYNKTKIGHEAYNFQETRSGLYGYFQPTMAAQTVALERIDSSADNAERLQHVLVVFVARRPEGGQVVVGWYKDAEVRREQARHSPGKPAKWGHFCSAESRNSVLLPADDRRFNIPSGNSGFGQSNVCYPLEANGRPKNSGWIRDAVEFVDRYRGSNLLIEPEADAETESAAAAEKALARSNGQGFARTAQERKAIEDRAMVAATKYFEDNHFEVEDVHLEESYDLRCTKGDAEIHVEVKGTTTDGGTIVLTNKEVKHASDDQHSCVMFVLHSIRLNRKKALGGRQFVIDPWRPKKEHLTPVSFTYRFPTLGPA